MKNCPSYFCHSSLEYALESIVYKQVFSMQQYITRNNHVPSQHTCVNKSLILFLPLFLLLSLFSLLLFTLLLLP